MPATFGKGKHSESALTLFVPGLQEFADGGSGSKDEDSTRDKDNSEHTVAQDKFRPSLIPVEERQSHFEETLYNSNRKKMVNKRNNTGF